MPYILIYFLCLLRSKFWADRYSKNDLTFLLCKVIYRCKKAGARGIASAFEIFISSNCQRLLYSKGQKFHSINKASNGTWSYGEIAIKGSTEPIISRIFRFQQPLQNRVPRMAQRSKYGVTPPYFGHRKRGAKQLQVRLYTIGNLVGIIIALVLRRFCLLFSYR